MPKDGDVAPVCFDPTPAVGHSQRVPATVADRFNNVQRQERRADSQRRNAQQYEQSLHPMNRSLSVGRARKPEG